MDETCSGGSAEPNAKAHRSAVRITRLDRFTRVKWDERLTPTADPPGCLRVQLISRRLRMAWMVNI